MVEYEILLRPSQLKFLSDNYDALFCKDPDIYPTLPPCPKGEGSSLILRLIYYNDMIRERYNEEYEKVSEIKKSKSEFDENSRSTPLIRRLYGILGFERWRTGGIIGGFWSTYHYHNFFVPDQNFEATKAALSNGGIFSKEFPDEDTDILKVIFERNQELRELGIRHRYPLFYASEISNISGIPREEVEQGLFNLIGVLGFCREETFREDIDSSGEYSSGEYWARRWFVPRTREGLIKNLIS